MSEQEMATAEDLERELAELDSLIERAAVDEDVVEFLRLEMRRAAIPALIRQARAAPVREELEALEAELEALEEEAERVRSGPAPEVAAGQRGHVTPAMMRNQQLAGITDQASSLGQRVKARRRELEVIEAEVRCDVT